MASDNKKDGESNPAQAKRPRVIGILSGKGGVGKSVTSVNLSALLTQMGKTNVLVDGDLSNPSVGLHLGLSYNSIGLSDCLSRKHNVADAIVIQPQTGMRILPASLKYNKGAALKGMNYVIDQLKAYDFIIIDSPPGLTQDAWYIMSVCSDIILITTPDIPSVTSAAKTMSLCKKAGATPIGVVINRITKGSYELTSREISSMIEAPVIAEIPEDYAVPASIAARTPLVLYRRDSPASKRFALLARRIAGDEPVEVGAAGFIGRIIRAIRSLLHV